MTGDTEVSTRGVDVLSKNPIAGDVRDSFYENFNRGVIARTNSRDTFGIEPDPKHYSLAFNFFTKPHFLA